jgi:hypothetical protein
MGLTSTKLVVSTTLPMPLPPPRSSRPGNTASRGPNSIVGESDRCMPALMPDTKMPLLHWTCSTGKALTLRLPVPS